MIDNKYTAEEIYFKFKSMSELPVAMTFYLVKKEDGGAELRNQAFSFTENSKDVVISSIERILKIEDFIGFPEKGDLKWDTKKLFEDYIKMTDSVIDEKFNWVDTTTSLKGL